MVTKGNQGIEEVQKLLNKGAIKVVSPVCQQDFLGPQERWLPQASDQPQTVESVHCILSLQDGESSYAKGPAEARRLDGFNQPEGCLPVSGNLSEIPAVCMEQQALRVSVSSLRSMQYPWSIYQASETSASMTPPPRGQVSYVPGRYAGDSPEERRLGGTAATDNVASGDLGLCSEPREVVLCKQSSTWVS